MALYMLTSWSSCILRRESKLRPLFPLSNSWVDDLLVCSKSDAARRLDLLAIVVESPCDDRLGTVFVCRGRIGGEGISNGVFEFFIISPVRAAVALLEIFLFNQRGRS